MTTPFPIALVQMSMTDDPSRNLRHGLELIEQAAKQGARMICLPELFKTHYFCQQEDPACFDWAESIPGPTTQALSAAAARLKAVLITSVFERRGPGLYHNTAVVFDVDGTMCGTYRKMHIPDDPCYYEKYYFTPGDLGFKAIDTSLGRIGVLVCWDQWFPEAARLMALQGALALFYPTAIGWHPHEKSLLGERQREAWRLVQRGHAVANGIYVAAVNRTGHEKPSPDGVGLEFWGSSFIADPQGVLLADAPIDREEILLGLVDPAHLENIRRCWPFFRDRRIDAYEGLHARYLGDRR
ncbi:MAG TPA: acyltransferase [Verrucomicrobia bacterium]|nr:MAG: acyltransferase [Lentisphaerae bacterium GWF2_57_35]HBA84206.1 acyltransferase [Verrucomicrobiota bacterium]